MKLLYPLYLSLFFICSMSHASFGNPDNWCHGDINVDNSSVRLGKLTGVTNEKIHFLDDDNKCPDEGGKSCIKKAYLIPGDQVIATQKYKKWVCTQFISQNKKGKIKVVRGWLPADKLQLSEPDSKPALAKWIGNWSDGYQSIEISAAQNGMLKISGQAQWVGLNGNVHEGEAEGTAKPQGNRLVIQGESPESCTLKLTLVDKYLIAYDNGACGGANVSFNGTYLNK